MEKATYVPMIADPDAQRKYAQADRFAWKMMLALSFAGYIGVQFMVRDERISLILCAICITGLISRELYLNWIFGGDPPPVERIVRRAAWRGHLLHIALAVLIWLVPDISRGEFSAWTFAGALMSGAGLAGYLWWRQAQVQRASR